MALRGESFLKHLKVRTTERSTVLGRLFAMQPVLDGVRALVRVCFLPDQPRGDAARHRTAIDGVASRR